MSDRALMQQALDTMEFIDGCNGVAILDPILRRELIAALRARLAQPESDPDPSRCPKCGGDADNGHDRCDPPNPYHCTKCMAQPEPEPEPVAWMGAYDRTELYYSKPPQADVVDLYAAPPPRQWVDLTDEDKQDLYSNWGVSLAAMHFVSERLKAKNGGTE